LFQKIKVSSGFQGFPVKESKNIYRSHNPYSIVKHLPEYKELLDGVKITNKDYEAIVKEYDSPSTFFFIDPPYEKSEAKFGYAEHAGFDFERLKEVVDKIKGDFLLTINDSPRIREMFKDYYILAVNVDNPFKNIASKKKLKKYRKELFITNYPTSKLKH
jgi:DNA adenine methylase